MIDTKNAAMGAVLFGVYADLAFNIMSATNSSPQTTELFAKDRGPTLWRWVVIGAVVTLALSAFGAWHSKSVWPLIGGAVVIAIGWGMYSHALSRGGGSKGKGPVSLFTSAAELAMDF